MDEQMERLLTKKDIRVEEGDYSYDGFLYCGKWPPRQVRIALNGQSEISNYI